MRKPRPILTYILLIAAQVLLNNFLNFTQMFTFTLLPVLILCLPTGKSTTFGLFVAFAIGFAVNFLSDGMLGLCSMALLPVALLRRGIITLVFGQEVFSRNEQISVKRQGFWKMMIAIMMATALYLAIYIWADGAGTRPFWFNTAKFFISLAVCTLISMVISGMIDGEGGGLWK